MSGYDRRSKRPDAPSSVAPEVPDKRRMTLSVFGTHAQPGSAAEGAAALREIATELRRLAMSPDEEKREDLVRIAREDLVRITGVLRGLAMRFERFAPEGK